MSKMFHLGYFQSGSTVHWAWQQPQPGARNDWMSHSFFIERAQALERACFDYILLEDNSYVPDRYNDSRDFYLKNGLGAPRPDPMLLATLLALNTSKIGLVPTIPTFAYPPYTAARLLGTLDQLSNGRAGWNMVTGSSARASQNYGSDEMEEHDHRYDIADEFATAVNLLCESWDRDAIISDRDNGVYIDPAKVHDVDFEGRFFKTRGPLNVGPLVQQRPVLAQAGSSPRGRQFASQFADTVVAPLASMARMKEFRDDVRRRKADAGMNPDDVKVLFIISPTIGATDTEAEARQTQIIAQGMTDAELALATLSKATDIDFGEFDLDEELGNRELTTNGTQSALNTFVENNRGKTLREAGAASQVQTRGTHGLIGSYATVAKRIVEMNDELDGDGFLIGGPVAPGRQGYIEITDGLVPELQNLGAVRRELGGATFRENMLAF